MTSTNRSDAPVRQLNDAPARTAALCGALALACVFPFLSRMGYRATDLELVVIAGSMAIAGGATGYVLRHRLLVLRLVLLLEIYWIVDLYFSPSSSLAGIVAIGIIGVFWTRFRPNVEAQLLIFSIGFSVVMGISAHRSFVGGTFSSDSAEHPDLPPIIHVVLDEFMSPAAIAALPNGERLAKRITDDYSQRGFRVMSTTRSESAWSPESIGRTFNPAQRDWPIFAEHASERHDARRYPLPRNQYFETLQSRGYEIEVIESEYIGLCTDASTHCRQYPFGDYGHGLARYVSQLPERIRIALEVIYVRAGLSEQALEHVAPLAWIARHLTGSGAAGEVTRSASMPELFDIVRDTIERVPLRGRAFVIHALFPHFPWVLDAECRLLPAASRSAPVWKNNSLDRSDPLNADGGAGAYLAQTECAHRQTMMLIDTVRRRPNYRDARFLIHGDHGARISDASPMLARNESNAATPNILLDALFAIAGPDIPAGVDHRVRRLPERFEEALMVLLPPAD